MRPAIVALELVSAEEIRELDIALRARRRALERLHFAVDGDPHEHRQVVWGLIDRLSRLLIDSICASCGIMHRGPCLEREDLTASQLLARRA